jgi:hypothetical protein
VDKIKTIVDIFFSIYIQLLHGKEDTTNIEDKLDLFATLKKQLADGF